MKRVKQALRIAFDGVTLVAIAVLVYLYVNECSGHIGGG